MLRQELREVALYNTLIEAIAMGNTMLNDIYSKTQINKSKISVYLRNLIKLEIIRREFPVLTGEKEKVSQTRGLYSITDNFFGFWFAFVFASLSDLEAGDAEGVYQHFVLPQLNEFASPVFENICREFVRKQSREGKLPFRAAQVGRWWGKAKRMDTTANGKTKLVSYETEIDVMAIDKGGKNVFLGECKFRNSEVATGDYEKLAQKRPPINPATKITYGLFSKSGFSPGLIDKSDNNPDILLYTLADLLKS